VSVRILSALAGLALVVLATGCAGPSAGGATARSDRLRESRLPRTPSPAPAAPSGPVAPNGPVAPSGPTPDVPTPVSFPSPAVRGPEPDATAVIDWLLNQKR
jgi:hypothetical protein